MSKRNIVVIGASAGGFEPIEYICRSLPPDFPAAVFITWHIDPMSTGLLPNLINQHSKLIAENAYDSKYQFGHIYVAPPDRHLIIQNGLMRTTQGPKENRFRPAIDPLFRSAAYYHNQKVIGVILSGMLNDGTAGLWAIKDRGGVTIVQDPSDAAFPDLPNETIRNVHVDYILPVKEIPELVLKLTREDVKITSKPDENLSDEINFALGDTENFNEMDKLGKLTSFTCPECNGALWEMKYTGPTRLRCHRGHAYTLEYYLRDLKIRNEYHYWNLMRGIHEMVELLTKLKNQGNIDADKAEKYEQLIRDYNMQADSLKKSGRIISKRA